MVQSCTDSPDSMDEKSRAFAELFGDGFNIYIVFRFFIIKHLFMIVSNFI